MLSFDLGIYTLEVLQKPMDHPIAVEPIYRKENAKITAFTAGPALGRCY